MVPSLTSSKQQDSHPTLPAIVLGHGDTKLNQCHSAMLCADPIGLIWTFEQQAKQVFPCAYFYWHGETMVHGIGVVVPVVTSYFGHKRWTFR